MKNTNVHYIQFKASYFKKGEIIGRDGVHCRYLVLKVYKGDNLFKKLKRKLGLKTRIHQVKVKTIRVD